jgi:hypothetical protein
MDADMINGEQRSRNADADGHDRRRRFYIRLFVVIILLSLPVTMLLLYLLTFVGFWPQNVDITGLLAISVGILGVLIFFMFLYKYQIAVGHGVRERWMLLAAHAVVVLVLFFGCIWLAFDSPWSQSELWGEYSMYDVAKTWIISVLVVGSISLLGSLFDIMRNCVASDRPPR